ncbi:uncharacterized protein LOC122526650 [Polistes fuscatus]|uniref:uncharacterized protein LOC122526650 n=1 Tax=Polistes fuscatus TaxID=30207 RepID=UPI001CA85E23|nr:uncharacterized protein LOC122526650 [Polistes fuscatus]
MSQVWVLGRNRLIKSVIRVCMPCQRAKPQLAHQLRGELPVDRVVGSRAFANSGLDYAGPVQVRMSKGRGNRSGKGYIALFVCFATRAIHLELVSDLSSESFLCAYRRFVGRRGICRNLYSDIATNFQGPIRSLRLCSAGLRTFIIGLHLSSLTTERAGLSFPQCPALWWAVGGWCQVGQAPFEKSCG